MIKKVAIGSVALGHSFCIQFARAYPSALEMDIILMMDDLQDFVDTKKELNLCQTQSADRSLGLIQLEAKLNDIDVRLEKRIGTITDVPVGFSTKLAQQLLQLLTDAIKFDQEINMLPRHYARVK